MLMKKTLQTTPSSVTQSDKAAIPFEVTGCQPDFGTHKKKHPGVENRSAEDKRLAEEVADQCTLEEPWPRAMRFGLAPLAFGKIAIKHTLSRRYFREACYLFLAIQPECLVKALLDARIPPPLW